ncbi:MAG: penicillin-binding protein [Prevotella sp.]|nr:penicillin-binding protein [Prevotella sp.]
MSKFNHKKIMPRYSAIAIVMTLLAFAVVGKAMYIMTAEHDYWEKVAKRVKNDSVSVKPNRGNILSCDGQLMASSLPEFKMYMDFQALEESKTDTLWDQKIDTICLMLSQIFPEKSANEFKKHLDEGRHQVQKNGKKGSRHWPIVKRRVDFNTLAEVRSIPIFDIPFNTEQTTSDGFIVKASYRSGFSIEEYNSRLRPHGSLAGRTIGDLYKGKDSARYGLELSYDSILRGENGIIHRRKVLNKWLDITDMPPVDGADIVTTIDVGIQDLAERAVIDELKLIGGDVGVAIVMEVETGDIKAIVNMESCGNGQYREMKNRAVSDLLEPGSVFKTASIMVCLDDGKCDTTKRVETASGIWTMYGRPMKDHNYHKGGYGTLTLPQTLHYSSNIGVSRIVDEYYHNQPEKFVEGIYRTGLADNLQIPLMGSSPARIRMPQKDKTGRHWANWSNTALPWMSIGYESQVPPISTLTFYNAIANNGRMMRPRFVKQVVKNGEVINEYPPVVLREHIAKPQTINKIQPILEQVVSIGTGKNARSKSFKVAGKTGTAQIWTKAGKTSAYLLSFVGYFPADAPRYSCIVCIQKRGMPASGGMSAKVFHHISEGILAQNLKLDVKDARDSLSVVIPNVKNGNLVAADYVLSHLGVSTVNDWTGDGSNAVWGSATQKTKQQIGLTQEKQFGGGHIPNVIGMGARDAVYQIEKRGVRVRLKGRGRVVKQSLEPGHAIKKGDICELQLEV